LLEAWREARKTFEERQDRFLEERPEVAGPPLPLEAYTGTCGGEMYGDATISVEGGALVLRLLPNPDLVADLTPLQGDAFLVEWRRTFAWFGRGAAIFELGGLGEVTGMHLEVPNDDLWFYEVELRRKDAQSGRGMGR